MLTVASQFADTATGFIESDDDPWAVTRETDWLYRCCEALTPVEKPPILPWAREKIVNNEKRPYDHGAYPHHGAPGGPMDAWDCATVREISLQWGTRLGKTFFAQVCLLYIADNDPAPCMHANAIEGLCIDVLERLYVMISLRESLEKLLLKRENERRQDLIEFRGCKIDGAWSKSVSTLADKNIKIGHAAEIDKWVHMSTSREAHPLELFLDRFKDYWSTRKVVWESTPTIKGSSPIEHRLLNGTNCRLHVPCRLCKRYQTLDFNNLKWDKPDSGRLDPAMAHATGRYECKHCNGVLTNSDRSWMIRRGVWCPQGCEVVDEVALEAAQERMLAGPAGIAAHGDDGAGVARSPKWLGWKDSPWIRGTPYRDGPEASYQLSSLYALSLNWGDIAKRWVESFTKPERLRNFINQWLAETWEPRRQKSTAEQVAERIGTRRPMRLVPSWGRYLTLSVDRQAGEQAENGHVVWVVEAHGAEDRKAEVAHGFAKSLDDVYRDVWESVFPAEDGGPPFRISIAGVDSGWNTLDTYRFCNEHEGWFALKGSSTDLGGKLYQITELKEGSRSGATGQTLIFVATDTWEEELDDLLHNAAHKADQSGSFSLSEDAAKDFEFLDQLLNGVLGEGVNPRGEAKNQWKKKRESDPNDYRDAVRYGLCLGRAWLDDLGGEYPPRAIAQSVNSAKPRAAVVAGESRPDGRPWL